MVAPAESICTIDQYLAFEYLSPARRELYATVVYALADMDVGIAFPAELPQ